MIQRWPEGSTSSGARWPALAIRRARLDGSSSAYTIVTKRPQGKSSIIMLLRRVRTSAGPEPVWASERSMPRGAGIDRERGLAGKRGGIGGGRMIEKKK